MIYKATSSPRKIEAKKKMMMNSSLHALVLTLRSTQLDRSLCKMFVEHYLQDL